LEKVEEHCHAQGSERMDQRRYNGEHRNRIAHHGHHVSDEARNQQNRKQRHADKRQDCDILESHVASISNALFDLQLRAAQDGVFISTARATPLTHERR
jgi:hypothetical protein